MSFGPSAPVQYTPASTVGAMFIEAMGPWLTLPLCWLLDAAGSGFDEVFLLAADQGFDGEPGYVPGYSSLLNPITCPDADLPFLAQFVGAQIPAGSTPAVARSIIVNEPGQQRGSVGSIVAAAQRNLSGSQSCVMLERTYVDGTPNPDWFVLVVRPEQLVSLSALTAAVNLAKPGGVMWSLTQSDGWVWSAAVHTWAADTFTWATSGVQQP